jgi:crotonobetainyl-CoA:carnitine CoA-transferase CaiB-like acyl-CoA transferase
MSSPFLPLRGVRVIEFCQIAAGPFAGLLLADLGADVIKVESPEGDGMRNWPPHTGGYSENFASLNRGKRSVVLDLKDPAGLDRARRLCVSADVVLENFRPGVMRRLGLGYDYFEKRKPQLVYCSISAFGQAGPRSQEGGFDVTLQAIGGVMKPGRPPALGEHTGEVLRQLGRFSGVA